MKHIKKMIALVAPALCLATACDNSEYGLDKLVPEEYHKVSSFKSDAEGSVKLFEIDDESTMNFTVLRTGSDPSAVAEVGLVSMTQEELSLYNAGYILVEPSYYTIEKTISFDSGESFKNLSAVFSPEAVRQLKEKSEELTAGQELLIALKLDDIGNCSVDKDRNYILRRVVITKPALQLSSDMGSPDGDLWWVDLSSNPEISLSVEMDTDNVWDFDCEVVYNPALVDAYNAANGTSFAKYPVSGGIGIQNGTIQFAAGENGGKSEAKLKIARPPFSGATQYLIPIEIKQETFIGEVYYIVVDDRVPLKEYMLSAPFYVDYDGQWFAGIVDDDPNTYWHSPWKDPLYLPEDEYGHWFQIKLEKPLNEELCFRYWTRNSPRTTPWTIKMLASSDNGNSWDEVAFVDGDLPLAGGNWMSPVYDLPKAKVTDLRFCVIRIENFGYSDNRCGFDPGACTCIAGFRVWGQ